MKQRFETIKKGMGIGIVLAALGMLAMTSIATATSSGDVWTWGLNDYGQLGDGATINRLTPVQVSGLADVIEIAGGGVHTIALKLDGTVWTWGSNDFGQLGDGTITNRLTPVQVSGLADVIKITGGNAHTIVLGSDGTIWACGRNDRGQLGDGTTINRLTPVQVSGFTNVIKIASGYQHTIALKADGTVWTWGSNDFGQLGDGTITNRLTPVQVSGLADVIEIAGGAGFTIALKSDGTVWTWGGNFAGQLGDGTTIDRLTPVQVSGLTNVIEVAGGANHAITLKSDGTVWTWGHNSNGDLGDGTTTGRLTPVQVSGLTDVIKIAGGNAHTVAIKSDSTVWTWGSNWYGQLGDGTTTHRWIPVQVSGFANVIKITSGYCHTIALVSVLSPPAGLSFPLKGYTPYTAKVESVMDHSMGTPYTKNGIVRAFNGEEGNVSYGCWSYSTKTICTVKNYTNKVHRVVGFKNSEGTVFLPKLNYHDKYLYYDGHPGYDYSVALGTDIFAPVDGTLCLVLNDKQKSGKMWRDPKNCPNLSVAKQTLTNWIRFHTFYIIHKDLGVNGVKGDYITTFLHSNNLNASVQTEVEKNGYVKVNRSQHIADVGGYGPSGSKSYGYHMHLEVFKRNNTIWDRVDPYGDGTNNVLWEDGGLPKS